ncbi:MAG: hypothetical protein JSV70_05685 [bacterium]|nr:MAG: hypothetical protein JSV70_05685 [bacterium]
MSTVGQNGFPPSPNYHFSGTLEHAHGSGLICHRSAPSSEPDVPVDRTGGGDAFAAGFLSGLVMGLDVRECGRRGNELAGRVIMEVGARPDITIPENL